MYMQRLMTFKKIAGGIFSTFCVKIDILDSIKKGKVMNLIEFHSIYCKLKLLISYKNLWRKSSNSPVIEIFETPIIRFLFLKKSI